MRDEINNNKVTKNECLILNLDRSDNDGTHWVCLFVKNGCSYYFDSFGFAPPLEVQNYCYKTEGYYNTFEIQKMGEVICGHYCIYVLYKLSGVLDDYNDFYDILGELYNYNH